MVADELSRVFAALADPTRRAIVERLRVGDATVRELGEPFDMSQPAVSKHLRVLEQAGLVTVGRDGQARPRRLDPEPLHRVHAWLAEYRDAMEERLDRFDDYLQTMNPTNEELDHHDDHDQ